MASRASVNGQSAKCQKFNHTVAPSAEKPLLGDSCTNTFPWIDRALNKFFKGAQASAESSPATAAEGIQALHDVTWGTWHPGHDEVSLLYNETTRRVEMTIAKTSRPNAEHKRPCILGVLEDAVKWHNEALRDLLNGRDLRLIVETEDFPMTAVGMRLPAFSMCWVKGAIDIPIPDFTFKCYPEARYQDTSWRNTSALLHSRSRMIGWMDREDKLSHRGNWGVGPRQSLMPVMAEMHKNETDEEVLGISVDFQNTEFVAANRENFQWVDAWCNSKYLIHTAGFSYSAGLKYRLACGSLVFKIPSKWVEFYEPGLEEGRHYVGLPPYEHETHQPDQYMAVSGPIIKNVTTATRYLQTQPDVAAAGQAWVLKNLSEEGLSCYWFSALKRYAQLYFKDPSS